MKLGGIIRGVTNLMKKETVRRLNEGGIFNAEIRAEELKKGISRWSDKSNATLHFSIETSARIILNDTESHCLVWEISNQQYVKSNSLERLAERLRDGKADTETKEGKKRISEYLADDYAFDWHHSVWMEDKTFAVRTNVWDNHEYTSKKTMIERYEERMADKGLGIHVPIKIEFEPRGGSNLQRFLNTDVAEYTNHLKDAKIKNLLAA